MTTDPIFWKIHYLPYYFIKVHWGIAVTDIGGSLEIFDNIGAIPHMKKYDTDTSLSFSISYKPLVQQKASLTRQLSKTIVSFSIS